MCADGSCMTWSIEIVPAGAYVPAGVYVLRKIFVVSTKVIDLMTRNACTIN